MVNYSNGKVYKIESITGEGIVYVGSTTKKYLSQRMDEHRRNYKYVQEGRILTTGKLHSKTTCLQIFDIYGIENCHIVLLETVNAQSKDELLIRETHYIKTLNSVNKSMKIDPIPKKEYLNQWYLNNKEKVSITSKKYFEENKEYVLNRNKEYYEKNKIDIILQEKEYRLINKEKIKQQKSSPYHCECGCIITMTHKAGHFKTKKHLSFFL